MKNRSVKSLSGSELLLFLFFVLVSCCLWLMLTLNQNYETDIEFNVSVKDVPEDVNMSSQQQQVVVRVRDRGTTLINYVLESFMPLSFDYSELNNKKGRLSLLSSVVQKRVKKQLQSSTAIVSLSPDTIVFYTQESAVKFPVALNADITPAKEYALGEISLLPDSVWVFAPASLIDTLRYISTEPFKREEVRDTLVFDVPLTMTDNATCTPSQVTVTVPVYPFTRKNFDVHVRGVDFPDIYKLRTFPSRVQVQVSVSLDNYELLNADDFEVGVSYLDIYGTDSNRACVQLLRAPLDAKDVKIIPSEVEFIIEQK